MALIQRVEIKEGTKVKILESKAGTFGAIVDMDRLENHREEGGLGRYSIGHYSKDGHFVGPHGSHFND